MYKTTFLFLFLFSFCLTAQVGIGTTTPDSSAALDVNSTSAGLLIPKMTKAQRDAISSPAIGLLIYQTNSSPGFYFYDDTNTWSPIGAASADFDWTISNDDIYNANVGNVGIGTTTPSTKLHLEDTSGSITIINQDFESGLTPFTTGGNANWHIQTTNVNTGTRAAGSGNISNSQTTNMEYNVTVPTGGATLSFYYSVSSESGFDFLRFYIAGVQQDEWSGSISYTQQSYALSAGTYVLKWSYEKDFLFDGGNDEAYIDDVHISTSSSIFRIVDGSQSSGYVLTSDASGNASWTDPTGNIGDDGDWTITGADMSNANTGQVSVINDLAGNSVLYVENETDSATAGSFGVHGVTNSVDLIGSAGVMGESITQGDHEIGVMGDYAFWGSAVVGIGYLTTVGDLPTTGSVNGGQTNDIGVFGSVDYLTGIGVYALNKDLTATGFGSYVDGNFAVVSGSKSGSVPTSNGNQLLYSMESPEIWFEDFGQAKLNNGTVHIELEEMYQETIFIDNEHPMHVFLQEQGDCNGLFFIPDADGKGFTVTEKQNGNSNITFSYRITAKRRFFQDHRFGVDPIQPFENNLLNAKYVEPRTSNLEEMRVIVNNAAAEKESQKSTQQKKNSKNPEKSKVKKSK